MRKISKIAGLASAISALALSPTANAIQYEGLSINGFATVAAGITDNDNTFRSSDYTNDLSFKPESKFAIQVTADMSDGLSATAQVMARGSNNFNAEFEWAYISYALGDDSTVRAGRLRIPFYKYSDYLDVGYAQPFSRPPKAMYNLAFSTIDGLSLLHNFALSSYDFSINATLGSVSDTFFTTTEPTDGNLESVVGINLQMTKDWFSSYVAYYHTKVDIPRKAIEDAADGLQNAGASVAAASKLRIDGDVGTFLGFGFGIDYEDIIFNAEYSTVSIENTLTLENHQWYAMAGYRLGKVTPYLMYETTENDRNTSTASAFPAPMQPIVQGAFDSQQFEFAGISAGVRYDFHSSAALKFEYNHYYDIVDISSGYGIPSDTEKLDIFTVSVDVVF